MRLSTLERCGDLAATLEPCGDLAGVDVGRESTSAFRTSPAPVSAAGSPATTCSTCDRSASKSPTEPCSRRGAGRARARPGDPSPPRGGRPTTPTGSEVGMSEDLELLRAAERSAAVADSTELPAWLRCGRRGRRDVGRFVGLSCQPTSGFWRFVAVPSRTTASAESPVNKGNPRKQRDAGGGTRTPDTRIMIPRVGAYFRP